MSKEHPVCAYCQRPAKPDEDIKVGKDTYFHRTCYSDNSRLVNTIPQPPPQEVEDE